MRCAWRIFEGESIFTFNAKNTYFIGANGGT
jgi:hypothetical protein